MTDTCCCPPEAGNKNCELPLQNDQGPSRTLNACPVCGMKGKHLSGQTVKALLSVSLREVQEVEYLFCNTQNCAVVYFSSNSEQTFTVAQVREAVYQKEPDNDDVFICYCFRHTVGNIRTAFPEARTAITNDIITGINAGQCACDLRNPQGSCCLGNVRELIRISTRLELKLRHESSNLD